MLHHVGLLVVLLDRVYLFPLTVKVGVGRPDVVNGCIPLFSLPFDVLQFLEEGVVDVCDAVGLDCLLIGELDML